MGLTRVRQALDALGHPERSYPHVLVAGTNGKGSTCIYLEKILMHEGMRVGTTLSPHISRFTERFRVQGAEAGALMLEGLRRELEGACGAIGLTYFEWCVVLAASLFAREGVDAGIFEVGLGGRYDAANALDPSVSIITAIGMDHMDYLGDTISEIALEKAQVARPGRPLVTSARGEARAVIRDHCSHIGARIHEVQGSTALDIPLSGSAQSSNAALACEAARLLGIRLDENGMARAVRGAFLAGRIEGHGSRIIMDVAHNVPSMLLLVEYLGGRGFHGTGVVGILADKEYLEMIRILKGVCPVIYAAPVRSPRSWGGEEMQRCASLHGITVCRSVREAFHAALKAGHDVVITGSFYTVSEVRELLICRGWPS